LLWLKVCWTTFLLLSSVLNWGCTTGVSIKQVCNHLSTIIYSEIHLSGPFFLYSTWFIECLLSARLSGYTDVHRNSQRAEVKLLWLELACCPNCPWNLRFGNCSSRYMSIWWDFVGFFVIGLFSWVCSISHVSSMRISQANAWLWKGNCNRSHTFLLQHSLSPLAKVNISDQQSYTQQRIWNKENKLKKICSVWRGHLERKTRTKAGRPRW
jgi:hypothetical protein